MTYFGQADRATNAQAIIQGVPRGMRCTYYVCTTHHKRVTTRCANRWGVPYNELTQAVIDHFSSRILMLEALRSFLKAGARGGARGRRPEARGARPDVRRLDSELARLAEAVASGSASIPALGETMDRKQRARDNAAAG
jgi:hypothetical protein